MLRHRIPCRTRKASWRRGLGEGPGQVEGKRPSRGKGQLVQRPRDWSSLFHPAWRPRARRGRSQGLPPNSQQTTLPREGFALRSLPRGGTTSFWPLMLPLLLMAVACRQGLFQLLWPRGRDEGPGCLVMGCRSEKQFLSATDLKPPPPRHMCLKGSFHFASLSTFSTGPALRMGTGGVTEYPRDPTFPVD